MTHLKFSTLPTNVDLDLNRILVFSASAFVCSCRSDSSLCFTVWRRSGIGAATSWDLSSDSNNNNICYSNNNNYYINNNTCSNNDVARRNVATPRNDVTPTTRPKNFPQLIVDKWQVGNSSTLNWSTEKEIGYYNNIFIAVNTKWANFRTNLITLTVSGMLI